MTHYKRFDKETGELTDVSPEEEAWYVEKYEKKAWEMVEKYNNGWTIDALSRLTLYPHSDVIFILHNHGVPIDLIPPFA